MFNFAKRVRERQLKRAVLVQNIIMLGIFSSQRKLLKIEGGAASKLDRVIAAAINQHFGKQADTKDFSKEDSYFQSKVSETIRSDPLLQQLILRVLLDIFTLSTALKATALLSEYPTIMEVLERGMGEHPGIFQDWKETQFKSLVERFADQYVPEKKTDLVKLFS